MKGLNLLLAAALFLVTAEVTSAEEVLHLPIGDPARSEKTVPLVLDAVTDAASGAVLTPSELPARLAGARILFVGETHTSVASHAVEYEVIRELARAGRNVGVGLEMYPAEAQAALDEWTAGRLSEAEFLEKSGWFRHWGFNFGYYRDIFVFARDHHLKLFGFNLPKDVVSTVGRKGLDALEPAQRSLLPPRVDWDNAEAKRLFKSFFDDDEFHGSLAGPMLDRMVQAQATFDAAFGWGAAQAAKAAGDPKSIVVVLAGGGHVFYSLGAERQARLWFDGKTASLVSVAMSNANKGQCDIRNVQASLADFVWGVPEDEQFYPEPGFSTPFVETGGEPVVIQVDKKSAAERAGVQVGDHVLSLDGLSVGDTESIHRAFADKRWGDTVKLSVRRGPETLSLDLLLRRERSEPCKAKS